MVNRSKKLTGPFLVQLRNRFREIAGKDNRIDRQEFHESMLIGNDAITDRIFDIFDKDHNDYLDSEEFLSGFQSLVNGSEEELIRFAFDIHDLDSSGDIDHEELRIFIKDSLIENDLDFDPYQVDLLVDEFFRKADTDKSETIDLKEFIEIAKKYPEFFRGIAVNPIAWLNQERYVNKHHGSKRPQIVKTHRRLSKVQVHDLAAWQWLLVPRLIYYYNILVNRRKNRSEIPIDSVEILPGKNISIKIERPDWFHYRAGDYVYLNCPWISTVEWYPFNIISDPSQDRITLNIKTYGSWSSKLYKRTIQFLSDGKIIDMTARLDGPYGSSSENIIGLENIILVGSGTGVSKFASILQDIALRQKNGDPDLLIKRLYFIWLSDNDLYFEWFSKLLKEIDLTDGLSIFDYHIFFIDRIATDLPKSMLYLSTDVNSSTTEIELLQGQRMRASAGSPDWNNELSKIQGGSEGANFDLFYCGPASLRKSLSPVCKKLGISIHTDDF